MGPDSKAGARTVIEVGGRRVTLTNLEKPMYPATGFTKAAVIDYYARISGALLPHLARRALTMVRWPDGVDGNRFFEKRCPPHAPTWVSRGRMGDLVACIVDDLPTLVWVANLASLELHVHQATVDDPEHPTAVVFDLDPGPPAGIVDCARVGLELRAMLEHLGLVSVVKTSGSKGLHLAVPVRGSDADDTKSFARALGDLLAEQSADRVTTSMTRSLRSGRVFIDWSQNDANKTTVCAYSLRAGPRPTVSAPVTWDEVASAVATDDATVLDFDADAVLERVERLGDLYAANLGIDQTLPRLG